METINQVLAAYDGRRGQFDAFCTKAETLIRDVLRANQITVSSISSRVKERNSLERKMKRPDAAYTELDQITDVVGLRIITLFEDEVDVVGKVIRREFKLDGAHCVDKRANLEPDRFGYLSLHYVGKISAARRKLTDWKQFADIYVEIQIRSNLQHTWAEIEHDLGYEGKVAAVPRHLRRRFSRLAGLLEIADDEFKAIRDEIATYTEKANREVTTQPEELLIDHNSMAAFIDKDKVLIRIESDILEANPGMDRTAFTDFFSAIAEVYSTLGFKTVAEVRQELSKREHFVRSMLHNAVKRQPVASFIVKGTSLSVLSNVIAFERGESVLRDLLRKHAKVSQPNRIAEIFQEIMADYHKALADQLLLNQTNSSAGHSPD